MQNLCNQTKPFPVYVFISITLAFFHDAQEWLFYWCWIFWWLIGTFGTDRPETFGLMDRAGGLGCSRTTSSSSRSTRSNRVGADHHCFGSCYCSTRTTVELLSGLRTTSTNPVASGAPATATGGSGGLLQLFCEWWAGNMVKINLTVIMLLELLTNNDAKFH